MWFFELRVSPKPDTDISKEAGGAFVNCWIDFREREGAEHLAKFYLAQEGWDHAETTESKWVEKQDYVDNPQGLQYFSEAETDSACFVIHQWSVTEKEESNTHTSAD